MLDNYTAADQCQLKIEPDSPAIHIRQSHDDLFSKLDDDPYDNALNKTGCNALNEAVLECYYDHRDWRVCQPQVLAFKACFEKYQKTQNKNITAYMN